MADKLEDNSCENCYYNPQCRDCENCLKHCKCKLTINETEVAYFIKYVQCTECFTNYDKTPPSGCKCCPSHDFVEFDLYIEKVKE